MDPFDFDNVKAEKANAMLRYRCLQKIANMFRLIEVCLALVLLSWFSTRLPNAFSVSSKYFRELCGILVSPRFVFLVGNAIIIILFAKSGQFSVQNPTGNDTGTDLYDEFLKSSESRQRIRTDNSRPLVPEDIVYQDKQTVIEERIAGHTYLDTKIYRRSQSENLKGEIVEKPRRELRRSETEKCREMESSGDKPGESLFSAEKLSNEEFQRRIDAFIEKHQRFRREEEESMGMAIVLHNPEAQ